MSKVKTRLWNMFLVFADMVCAKLAIMRDCEGCLTSLDYLLQWCKNFLKLFRRCRHTKSRKLSYIHLFFGLAHVDFLSVSLCRFYLHHIRWDLPNESGSSIGLTAHPLPFRQIEKNFGGQAQECCGMGRGEARRDKVINDVLPSLGPSRVHKVPKAVKRPSNDIALKKTSNMQR